MQWRLGIDSRIDPQQIPERPKIAPDAIARPSFERWMSAHAKARLRCVAAQAGAGKTTAAVAWARREQRRVTWIDLERGISADVRAALNDASDLDVVFDHVDSAPPETLTFVMQFCAGVPAHVPVVCLGRSPGLLDMIAAAQPDHVIADPELMRFDPAEVATLGERHGMTVGALEATTIVRMTHGWAMAIAGAVRCAAYHRTRLPEALARWRRNDTGVLHAVIDRALESAPSDAAALLADILTGHVVPTDGALAALADAGLFVDISHGKARLNPIVAGVPQGLVAHAGPEDAHPAIDRASIEIAGSLRMIVAGQEVEFNRRRDAQIVHYLALRPDGRATRAEIIDAFWPDADRHLAGQALRTACSTIRRAIAECVGYEHIERFFSTSGSTVALVAAHVTNPIAVFRRHCELAAAADARGEVHTARRHWIAADRLYPASIWCGAPPSRAIAELIEALEALAATAKSRTADGR